MYLVNTTYSTCVISNIKAKEDKTLDKYEYKLKYEDIKKKIKQRQFVEAVEVADTIDWTKIRSVTTLCTISDLYKINRRYKEAKVLLEQAYDKYPNGKNIVYSLCELCIKMEEIVQSIEYYKQYVQMAPTDNGRFILQYKIYEAQDVSLEERIQVLEELKKREYKEKWGYELAYLYHRIGLITKCVEECDELIIWFRDGAYVKKAMELKMLHQELTENQMDIYQSMLPQKEKEEFIRQNTIEMKQEEPEDDIRVKTMDIGKFNTLNLQKELAESMKEVLVADNGFMPLTSADDVNAQPGTYIPDDFSVDKLSAPVQNSNAHPGTTTENFSRTILNDEPAQSQSFSNREVSSTGTLTANAAKPGEMEEIFFEDDTQQENIYEEVPAIEETEPAAPFDPVKDLELTMMYDSEHVASKLEALKASQEENIDEEALEEAKIPKVGTNTAELIGLSDTVEIVEPIESTKVFNREELHAVAKAYNSSLKEDSYGFEFNDPAIKQPHDDLSDHIKENKKEEISYSREELSELIDKKIQESIARVFDVNREITVPIQREPERVQPTVIAQDRIPKGMENILSQEYDGQMSLVVPDAPVVEKQITGQMSIEDVLNEWENIKKQQKEKSEQLVAQKILAETGSLFTETESLRIDGILEKLQRDEIPEEIDTEAEYEKYIQQLMEDEAAESQTDDASKTDSPVEEEVKQEEIEVNEVENATDEEVIEEPVEVLQEEIAEEVSEEMNDSSEEAAEESDSIEEPETTSEEENDEVEELTEIEETADDINEPEEQEVVSPEVEAAKAQALAAQEAAALAIAQAEAAKKVAEEAAAAALVAQAEADAAKETEEAAEESDPVEEPETTSDETEPEENKEAAKEVKEEAALEETAENNAIDSRAMNDDELTLFSQFAQTKRARQNLLHSLDKISLAAYTGNVFVTGETAEESLELAKNVIRYVKNTDGNFTGKIAKVSGDALNNKMISVMIEKLANGGLIIEKASGMSAETTKDLLRSLNQEKTGIVVALQDTKKNMNKMMEYFDGMKHIFNIHIEVEELSDDALVAYGKKYAEHLEYSIDEMGILALHQRIDVLQTSDHVVTVSDVRDIIDEAIEKANKKSFKHFTDVLLAKRYDDEDMIILRESDFITKE